MERLVEKKIYRNPDIPARINKLLSHPNLSPKHREVLVSFLDQFESRGGLTIGQYRWFSEGPTSLEATYDVEKHKEWTDSFTKEMYDDCVLLAKMYHAQKSPYWIDLVNDLLTKEDYIPSKQNYHKFVENKYAQGYLKAWKSEAKYPVSSVVVGRAHAPWNIANKIAYVLETNSSYPRSHAKGAKVYSVAVVGFPTAIEVEEKHLKKYTEGKKNG